MFILQQPVLEQADAERDLNQEANDEEKQEKRLQEGIGIPHMVINHSNVNDRPLYDVILDFGKLPPPEEVSSSYCNDKRLFYITMFSVLSLERIAANQQLVQLGPIVNGQTV